MIKPPHYITKTAIFGGIILVGVGGALDKAQQGGDGDAYPGKPVRLAGPSGMTSQSSGQPFTPLNGTVFKSSATSLSASLSGNPTVPAWVDFDFGGEDHAIKNPAPMLGAGIAREFSTQDRGEASFVWVQIAGPDGDDQNDA